MCDLEFCADAVDGEDEDWRFGVACGEEVDGPAEAADFAISPFNSSRADGCADSLNEEVACCYIDTAVLGVGEGIFGAGCVFEGPIWQVRSPPIREESRKGAIPMSNIPTVVHPLKFYRLDSFICFRDSILKCLCCCCRGYDSAS